MLVLVCQACTGQNIDKPGGSAEQTPAQMSILDLMTSTIVPVTNALWGIDEPQSDEEWQSFLRVADESIAAFEQTRAGGSGQSDAAWAADPRWTDYSNQAIEASQQYKAAIRAQDMEAIWTAGDALLAPCTACHQDFNPAVKESNSSFQVGHPGK